MPDRPGRPPKGRRVLVASLSGDGGVATMRALVTEYLARAGYEPVVAYYQPYSIEPTLSVPLLRLLQRRVGVRMTTDGNGEEMHAVGAWLPELEFTHFAATRLWREIIASCDFHIAVSGNALAATALMQTGKHYLGWIATDWESDREQRIQSFSAPRRALDRYLNGPVLRRLEGAVLRHGRILALSQYTERRLNNAAGKSVIRGVMPMGVDVEMFRPDPGRVIPGRIGFVGRLSDPRKNIELLLLALAALRAGGGEATLVLIGGALDAQTMQLVQALRLEQHVELPGKMSKAELSQELQTLDAFVVASHQEGLCIAALEAMACGCPVVSTRCGGPEEFVLDDQTGFLAESEAGAMASAIRAITEDRQRRTRLSENARRLVTERYSQAAAENVFWQHFRAVWPQSGEPACYARS